MFKHKNKLSIQVRPFSFHTLQIDEPQEGLAQDELARGMKKEVQLHTSVKYPICFKNATVLSRCCQG